MVSTAGGWTADDLDRLPDDGNRYEVVDGELFVTPSPRRDHQVVGDEFYARLRPFVMAKGVGRVFFSPCDVHVDARNRVQPDIFVEPRTARGRPADWSDAPKPILVVEILSESTARRDAGPKRALYSRMRIAEYWIVDAEARSVQVVKPGEPDRTVRGTLEWRPAGAAAALTIDLPALFRDALDG